MQRLTGQRARTANLLPCVFAASRNRRGSVRSVHGGRTMRPARRARSRRASARGTADGDDPRHRCRPRGVRVARLDPRTEGRSIDRERVPDRRGGLPLDAARWTVSRDGRLTLDIRRHRSHSPVRPARCVSELSTVAAACGTAGRQPTRDLAPRRRTADKGCGLTEPRRTRLSSFSRASRFLLRRGVAIHFGFGIDIRLPGGNQWPQPLRDVLSLVRDVVPLADILGQIEYVAFAAVDKQLP